ncbi:ribosomal RNA-processing protein 8 isoform X2 [Syngnathus scovelli]|uniref:ribosomal RNA-processing protein 8 isoform X2 n=1 Tax=Syngnathus scovelli TaxID=161590 RepID=UPI00211070CB|nr:ribosomal RNA-processing protein 8 isoform X2 [Syngnathus scovelli]
MFNEDEDWNDAADVLSQSVVKKKPDSKSPNGKSKHVGKKSLLRTLQMLESIPDWKDDEPQPDSDSDLEAAAPHTKKKRKKKRRKRTKQASSTTEEREDNIEVKEDQSVTKKNKVEKKIEITQRRLRAPAGETEDKEAVQKSAADALKFNRQQWKNKMKNKRKCKNKYQQIKAQKEAEKDEDKPPATGCAPLTGGKPVQAPDKKTLPQKKTDEDNAAEKDEDKCPATGCAPLTGGKPVQAPDKKALPQKKTDEDNAAEKDEDKSPATRRAPVHGGKRVKAPDHTALPQKRKKTDAAATAETEAVKSAKRQRDTPPVNGSTRDSRTGRQKAEQLKAERLKRQHLRKLLGAAEEREEEPDKEEEPVLQEAEDAPEDRSGRLRRRMEQRLEAARFRHINQFLYCSSSGEAKRMFQQDPPAFGIYHRGFAEQVRRWPANPVDAIIDYIQRKPPSLVVADFGCGDCKIALSVKNKVHSFDLVALCDLVTVCDMAHVPLQDRSVDIAVFCLSLMGTNLAAFLAEANRVLKRGGKLKIAEVASRFDNVRNFLTALTRLGFKLESKDTENTHFYTFDLIKTGDAPPNVKNFGLQLKACLYKKR